MASEQFGDLTEAINHARMLLQKGEYARTLEQVEEIDRAHPGDVRALFLKGAANRRIGEHEAAREQLERVVTESPGLARAHQELGHAYFALRLVESAKRALRYAVQLDPKLAGAWLLLGEILAIEGQQEEAQEAFRNHYAATAQHPAILKAVEFVNQGKLGMAEGICREYLMRYPTDVNAIRLFAEIGLKIGVFDEAEKLLERCLELAPDYHLARNNYANVLSKAHKFDRALEEIAYLEKVEPNNFSHPVLAASILVNVGEYGAAIERYERVLASAPHHARLRMSMGHALKTVGRQQDCVAAYRGAIASQPTLGEAYWSLANLKTFRFDDAEIHSMRQLLEAGDLDASDEFNLSFALAKALEDAGEFDEAFAFYARGNDLKMARSRYSADENEQRIDAIIEHSTARLFEQKKGFGLRARDPIFIVGLPRSGSTLLEQIIASHSQVEGTMELPYITQYAGRLGANKGEASSYAAMLRDLSDEQCRQLGQEYLDATAIQRTDSPYFIDKMPNNFAHVGLIHLILPEAKIIDARRHPMATCFSGFKQLFAAGQEFTYGLENIGRYYRDYLRMMDHWELLLPGKVLLVQYEEVIADFENQVRRLLDFCGLEFEAACLEFYASERAVRTASSEQVRQPIYRDAVEQWRNFEPHLRPLKDALGRVLQRFPP